MSDDLWLLALTGASVGFIHTVLGPDHYVPFVVLARVRAWSLRKTVIITVVCGIAHVLSSVALGTVGMALGVGLLELETVEAGRGALAGWLLLAFGLVYLAWGVRAGFRRRPHTHWHAHAEGIVHTHRHGHTGEHLHVHDGVNGKPSVTPWILFTIFLFGPCEPLIPVLMYPAAVGSPWNVVLVTLAFGVTTIATMTAVVLLALYSADRIPKTIQPFERYGHAMAGLAIVLCAVGIQLGW